MVKTENVYILVNSNTLMSTSCFATVLSKRVIRHHHWGKLGEVYMGPFITLFATSYEFLIISKENFLNVDVMKWIILAQIYIPGMFSEVSGLFTL